MHVSFTKEWAFGWGASWRSSGAFTRATALPVGWVGQPGTVEPLAVTDGIRRISEDLRALTPLFYLHVDPYGWFDLDMKTFRVT